MRKREEDRAQHRSMSGHQCRAIEAVTLSPSLRFAHNCTLSGSGTVYQHVPSLM